MIAFERATTEDAPILLEIKVRAFAWDVETYGMGPPDYDSLEDMIASIQRALYYKILHSDRIIGGFSLYRHGEEHFEIGSIYIDPCLHNTGLGTRTLEFIEAEFPHVKRWTLSTPYLSFRNHHFYEKMGYVKTGEEVLEELAGFRLFHYEKTI